MGHHKSWANSFLSIQLKVAQNFLVYYVLAFLSNKLMLSDGTLDSTRFLSNVNERGDLLQSAVDQRCTCDGLSHKKNSQQQAVKQEENSSYWMKYFTEVINLRTSFTTSWTRYWHHWFSQQMIGDHFFSKISGYQANFFTGPSLVYPVRGWWWWRL